MHYSIIFRLSVSEGRKRENIFFVAITESVSFIYLYINMSFYYLLTTFVSNIVAFLISSASLSIDIIIHYFFIIERYKSDVAEDVEPC